MPTKRTLREMIQKHEGDAAYAERKAEMWRAKAVVSRNRAAALKQQAKEAAQ